jgi:hypothetical protein
MHYFVLGPSGVGKTTFGDWLQANRQYDHLAVDRGDEQNGLIAEGLVDPWNRLTQGDAAPFGEALQERADAEGKKGCVLTFYSVDFFPLDWIVYLAGHDIAVRYLYGDKEKCIEAYLDREKREGHPKTREFWSTNNEENYGKIGAADLSPYRANIIDPSGKRLSEEEIAKLLKIV